MELNSKSHLVVINEQTKIQGTDAASTTKSLCIMNEQNKSNPIQIVQLNHSSWIKTSSH